MAYRGAMPWHGLGQLCTANDIDTWINDSGLGFTIERGVPYFMPTEGLHVPMQDVRVLYRGDNRTMLSIVAKDYKVVQPRAILEFFRDEVESGGLQIDTAGVLDEGRKLWALATNATSFSVGMSLGGHDTIRPYLLLVTSCDGTMATRCYLTTVRVVCNNTLAYSKKDSACGVTFRHSSVMDPRAIKQVIGLIYENTDDFRLTAEALASRPVSDSWARQFFTTLYTPKGGVPTPRHARASHSRKPSTH